MTSVHEHVAPAADFALYGLDSSVESVRWLDFFESSDGSPAWAVWLGHRTSDDSALRTGTFPRGRYTDVMCPRGGDPLAEVAFGAAFGLVNLTLPETSVPRPPGLIEALVRHAEQQAQHYDKWRSALWDVDGTSTRALVWNFAGAWAGFTDSRDDDFIVAIGIGIEPDGLVLSEIKDGAPYGVDLGADLDLGELGRQRHERPDTRLPPPQPDHFHPDQRALTPHL